MNKLQKIKEEADKSFNFNNSHNVMASQPKGVMAVNETKKLFDRLFALVEKGERE